MARHLFFRESRGVEQQLTDLFNFVWPTAAALWNLRWQVLGYTAARPDYAEKELVDRFLAGSGIRSADLKSACVTTTWDEQRDQFSRFLLIQTCAVYESWLSVVPAVVGLPALESRLQFPTDHKGKGGAKRGVGVGLDDINASESALLRDNFYASLIKNRKNRRNELEALLKCYRFFKECRNAVAHRGGIANTLTVEAYNELSPLDAKALGVTEKPVTIKPVDGKPVQLELRGVVGLGDVVMRLVTTLDAELARSQGAEDEFSEQWLAAHGRKYSLKSDAPGRNAQVLRLVRKLGLPEPTKPEEIAAFLKKKRLVS
jgi:hypothetical protein